jgi:hypothetical protein
MQFASLLIVCINVLYILIKPAGLLTGTAFLLSFLGTIVGIGLLFKWRNKYTFIGLLGNMGLLFLIVGMVINAWLNFPSP